MTLEEAIVCYRVADDIEELLKLEPIKEVLVEGKTKALTARSSRESIEQAAANLTLSNDISGLLAHYRSPLPPQYRSPVSLEAFAMIRDLHVWGIYVWDGSLCAHVSVGSRPDLISSRITVSDWQDIFNPTKPLRPRLAEEVRK